MNSEGAGQGRADYVFGTAISLCPMTGACTSGASTADMPGPTHTNGARVQVSKYFSYAYIGGSDIPGYASGRPVRSGPVWSGPVLSGFSLRPDVTAASSAQKSGLDNTCFHYCACIVA